MATEPSSFQEIQRIPIGMAKVPEGWRWAHLDSVCSGVFDCPHSTPKLTTEGPFVAKTQDIITGIFRTDKAAHVSLETYQDRIRRAEPQRGDLLYSREGTYFGIAAEVPNDVQVCLGQRMVLIRPNPAKVDFRFLRFWLNSPAMAAHVHGHRDGSVAERLNLPTIRSLPVILPGVAEQGAIASVLSALDDKIVVNERIAATAMELGGAKFQLLSSSTNEEGTIGDVVDLKYGKSLPAARRIAGSVPVFGSGGISGTHNEFLVKGPGIIIGRKGTVGAIYWSEVDFFPIDTTFYVSCKNSKTSLEYMYFALRGLGLEHMNSDSAVPGLNRERAQSLPLRIPASDFMQDFTAEARGLFQLQRGREEENRALAALRDTLLPQLMSGRLRVKDAEKIVEDHV
ncbi:restriction endonuclease subunit S [Streptomyces sp. NPDC002835]